MVDGVEIDEFESDRVGRRVGELLVDGVEPATRDEVRDKRPPPTRLGSSACESISASDDVSSTVGPLPAANTMDSSIKIGPLAGAAEAAAVRLARREVDALEEDVRWNGFVADEAATERRVERVEAIDTLLASDMFASESSPPPVAAVPTESPRLNVRRVECADLPIGEVRREDATSSFSSSPLDCAAAVAAAVVRVDRRVDRVVGRDEVADTEESTGGKVVIVGANGR